MSAPSLIQWWTVQYARGFGLGLASKAPGTLGSLLGVVVGLAIHAGLHHAQILPLVKSSLGIVLLVALTWVTYKTIASYEAQLKIHDDQRVVADEIAGQAIALGMLPYDIAPLSPPLLALTIVGFLVFRFLDIKKPWIIGAIDESWPGASGTLGDDVLAGVIAGIIVFALSLSPLLEKIPVSW